MGVKNYSYLNVLILMKIWRHLQAYILTKKPEPKISGIEGDEEGQDPGDLVEDGADRGKVRICVGHQASIGAYQVEDRHFQRVIPEPIVEAKAQDQQGEIDPVPPK